MWGINSQTALVEVAICFLDFANIHELPAWPWYGSINKFYHSISFTGKGDVWFSLNGTTYQNNSCVTLEDIGEKDDALLCMTNLTACCGQSGNKSVLGNWFFPNGTSVPRNGMQWNFYRTRGQMVVRLNRRRGGVDGIYSCVIPDSMNVNQTIYIGMYTANRSTGEWHCLYTPVRSHSAVLIDSSRDVV